MELYKLDVVDSISAFDAIKRNFDDLYDKYVA